MMDSDPATLFLVDLMVGRLVTWLRLLGYDTVSAGTLADREIARLAQRDGRTVLTRDRELARRRNVRSILIESEQVDEQLAQLVREGCVTLQGRRPRCPLCNGELRGVDKAQARESVPPYVFAEHDRFERCSSCGHIYWQGTHWQRMTERLARLAANSGDSRPYPSKS